PSSVMLAVSTDGGATWEHREVAEAPEGFDNLWAVQADVDASGAIHVAWAARVDDERMATYVATSRDLGRTWTTPLALRDAGLNFLPWVAAFGDSTVAVGWYGGDATGEPDKAPADALWYAYVAQSTDGGASFVVQRVSDTPVKKGELCPKGGACRGDRELLDYVSLAYDANGDLHYAYAVSEKDVARTLVATARGAATFT
ncbi:MAG TPA: sialidase family protein, partial [Candidatus Thermoplasmatota archaeon]|nr:sialidase family protein [Candidatus Thermoplasmatota archaeon]